MIPNQITYCLIWGQDYRATGDPNPRNSTSFVISDRTGGAYQITEEALELVEEKGDRWKALLTTWLIDQRAQGDKQPWVTTGVVKHIDGQRPFPAHERAERLLRLLAKWTGTLGATIQVQSDTYALDRQGSPRLAYACLIWSESVKWQEVLYLLRYLEDKGWVVASIPADGIWFDSQVTIAGHSQIEELETKSNSSRASIANARNKQDQEYKYDFFIAHASEDKKGFIRPLVKALQDRGAKVWYDEFELRVGMSLRQGIDRGLASSRFGVVVLSQHFFEKEWPQQELNGLWSLDPNPEGEPRILPIWHEVSREDIVRFSPMLVDRLALDTSLKSTDQIANELYDELG